MSKTLTSEVRIGARAGSGHSAAPGPAGILGFAAAPVFALMALWTGIFGGTSDMLCLAMQGGSPLGGMTLMYLLMSAVHLTPWLRLVRGR